MTTIFAPLVYKGNTSRLSTYGQYLKRMQKIIVIVVCLLTACSTSQKGVFFEEFKALPSLKLHNTVLTIHTVHTQQSASPRISKVHVSVDHGNKEIYLSAYKSKNKKHQTTFTIDLAKYQITEPEKYMFLWRDPDTSLVELDILFKL